MNSLLLLCTACLVSFAFCAQEYAPAFKTYQEMREHLTKLYTLEKYGEAAELLLWAREAFTDYLFSNTYNLVVIYAHLDQYTKGIDALQYALDRGVWFAPYFYESELWKPLKEQPGFEKILRQVEALKKKDQETAKPELRIVTPDNYDPKKKYPLFIALHGGSENIETFKDRWRSPKMSEEFITAYPQSSQVIAWNGYWWHGDIELARKELADAFRQVMNAYPVNGDSVIIGGFSSGGLAALEALLTNTIPATGFIVLCPDCPESFTAERIKEARNRGTRGTLITGEQDGRFPLHNKMVAIFENEGLLHQYVVIPELGHDYPEDLDIKIDGAIDYIRSTAIIEEQQQED
ncbi:MAG: hypothetical protein JSU64_05205 [candidate division WOR-3 bacterium]|nr:MAG: hypothetical protein JSU64_05205 [candidate division WOR-3 bacterium]